MYGLSVTRSLGISWRVNRSLTEVAAERTPDPGLPPIRTKWIPDGRAVSKTFKGTLTSLKRGGPALEEDAALALR